MNKVPLRDFLIDIISHPSKPSVSLFFTFDEQKLGREVSNYVLEKLLMKLHLPKKSMIFATPDFLKQYSYLRNIKDEHSIFISPVDEEIV